MIMIRITDNDKELHEEFLEELKQLLAKYEADISLKLNFYEQEVINIDFNRTDDREYSNIQLKWIDKHDEHIID